MSSALPLFQVMPPLSAAEYAELKADIVARGVMVPVEYDEDGNVLDGHHRVKICTELGIQTWPKIVRHGLTPEAKRRHAWQLNLVRRHLSREQREKLWADMRRDGMSYRRIAKVDGTAGVETVRRAVVSNETPDRPAKVTGKDGKSYPATRPTRSVFVDDSPEGKRAALDRAKDVRAERADAKRAERTDLLNQLSKRNEPLPNRRYPIIYADPPWEYDFSPSNDRSVENHYPTMPIEDILAIKVDGIATPDAMLFLWAPPSFIKKGIVVLEAWGFELATSAVWVKDKIGTGIYVRQQHEFLLLGKRGTPITPKPGTQPSSVIMEPRGKHSEKPKEVYKIIERMYPGLAKIELFCRDGAPKGWDVWGNQALEPHPKSGSGR